MLDLVPKPVKKTVIVAGVAIAAGTVAYFVLKYLESQEK